MTKVLGISFRENGKVYFFDPGDFLLKIGDEVIVETKLGKELGTVKTSLREIDEKKLKEPIKKVIKMASKEDKKHQLDNIKKEREAADVFKKKVKQYKIEMDLVEVKYLYRTRIELRQISNRDYVKRLGGNGVCGRELCCCSFLNSFDNVSIKMAKDQNLSLNVSKIPGSCGRLMCCLRYEHNVYEEKLKKLPHIGATVKTKDGEGTIDNIEVLREVARIKLKDDNDNVYFRKYPIEEIEIIKDTRRRHTNDPLNTDTKEDIQELKKIEEMDKIDKKNATDDDE